MESKDRSEHCKRCICNHRPLSKKYQILKIQYLRADQVSEHNADVSSLLITTSKVEDNCSCLRSLQVALPPQNKLQFK